MKFIEQKKKKKEANQKVKRLQKDQIISFTSISHLFLMVTLFPLYKEAIDSELIDIANRHNIRYPGISLQ